MINLKKVFLLFGNFPNIYNRHASILVRQSSAIALFAHFLLDIILYLVVVNSRYSGMVQNTGSNRGLTGLSWISCFLGFLDITLRYKYKGGL